MPSFIRFIKKIQNSPLHVRKMWLVVFTAPTMILVIFLWTAYMRASIGGGEVALASPSQEKTGVAEVVGTGVDVVKDRLTRGIERVGAFVGGFVGSSNVIDVEVPQGPVNFVKEDLDDIPRTSLP